MTFTLLILFMCALVMLELVLTHRQQSRGLAEARREGKRLAHYPSLSIVRPVRGADVGAAENYAAALDNGYPGEVETIFVFDDADDPAYAIAEAASAAHRAAGGHGSVRLIVAGQPPADMT